jgi:hypothetical protein
MKLRSLLVIGLFLSSCSRDIAERESLFLPELKLGAKKQQLEPQLAAKCGYSSEWDTLKLQEGPANLKLGYSGADSSLTSINYRYLNPSERIDSTAVYRFNTLSNKAIDALGTPDDWIRRDTVSGQRIVWYYDEDSSVVSLEQRRSGELRLELTRSGQRYRDVKYEMNNFLMAPGQ